MNEDSKNKSTVISKKMLSIFISNKGGDITKKATKGLTLTDANNRVSNIIAVDVQVSNDVIHVTNKVVLPPLT